MVVLKELLIVGRRILLIDHCEERRRYWLHVVRELRNADSEKITNRVQFGAKPCLL